MNKLQLTFSVQGRQTALGKKIASKSIKEIIRLSTEVANR